VVLGAAVAGAVAPADARADDDAAPQHVASPAHAPAAEKPVDLPVDRPARADKPDKAFVRPEKADKIEWAEKGGDKSEKFGEKLDRTDGGKAERPDAAKAEPVAAKPEVAAVPDQLPTPASQAPKAAPAVELPPTISTGMMGAAGAGLLGLVGVAGGAWFWARKRKMLTVQLVLDDDQDGRFCVALSPESAPALPDTLKSVLQSASSANLTSGLDDLPKAIKQHLSHTEDHVRGNVAFKVPTGKKLRLVVFGRSAARQALSLKLDGQLVLLQPNQVIPHAQERFIQLYDRELTVTVDLRRAARPRGVSDSGPRPTFNSSPSVAQTSPTPSSVQSVAPTTTPDADLQKKAREFFLAGSYEDAAKVYQKLGDRENEARCWVFLGKPEKVAKIDAEAAVARGDLEQAVNHYVRASEFEQAAACLRKLNRPKEAVRLLAEARVQKGQINEAALYLEQAGEFPRAAELYEQLKQPLKALGLYEKASLWSQAAKISASLGDYPRAAAHFQKGGEPAQASVLLYRLGRADQALEQALAVPPGAPGSVLAATVLARLYSERQQPDQLAELARRVASKPGKPEEIELLYALGTFMADRSLTSEAAKIFQRVGELDPLYRDVNEKLAPLSGATSVQSPVNRNASTMAELDPAETHAVLGIPEKKGSDSTQAVLPAGNGRYKLEAELGRGAMGIVYKATDTLLGRTVAIKTLPQRFSKDPMLSRMFLGEARSLATLNHPHIVQIYDMGEMNDTMFLAMEFVTGETLEKSLEKAKRLPVARVLEIGDQLAQALDGAHRAGLVHRDVKPANVMGTADGGLKLMDFGIAFAAQDNAGPGGAAGTPLYMSPEQIRGETLDGRADLYSLGVVLFQLLSGTLPFEGDNVLKQHLETPPPHVAERVPGLPVQVDALLQKLMAKGAADRFANAGELKTQIQALRASIR
jgi:tetratricopeptide (TPR) repeat protein/tRNA A-37 threonylcarbamoyl transferase component Bud32